MLVGLGPGDEEDEVGRPFVGPAGRLLDELLEEAGLERPKVYLTNAVKCQPPGNKVDAVHMATCGDLYLKAEILTVRPNLIVALGDVATRAVAGMGIYSGVVGEYAGRDRLLPQVIALEHPCWVKVTYHPSAVLRARGTPRAAKMRNVIVRDLTEAKGLVEEFAK